SQLNLDAAMPRLAAAPNWFISAIVYVAYNLILAIAVLVPLGHAASDRKAIIWGGLTGGLTLGGLALAIKLAIVLHFPDIAKAEVPLLYVAAERFPSLWLGYSLVLWSEIYSTAVSSMYGFASRISELTKIDYGWAVVATAAIALRAGEMGFASLVGTLYPLFGYASLVLLGGLSVGLVRGWLEERPYGHKA
ncbi:MAG: hypothetical protein M1602_03680, partial [Firmicutes bacterium]|nr:hypothetical protein [Bacillota bacterium]